MSNTALLVGSTGLVGNEVLNLIVNDSFFFKIIVLSRKPLEIKDEKVENIVVDFDNLEQYKSKLKADYVFCCLGTTIKQAGSEAAFKKVDYFYPLQIAKICKENGAKVFSVITALGSNPNSMIFYNKVKGELELALEKINFEALHIIQPSLLLGDRKETRIGEGIAQKLSPIMNAVLIGGLKKYKAIAGTQVAKAMLYYSKQNVQGNFIHSNETLFV